MMSRAELLAHLEKLNLTQDEAARLLSVNARTVRRWVENPSDMPGPAEQALRAWMRLHRLGLAWRPDGLPLGEYEVEKMAEQIAIYRQHAIDLDAVLQRVEARGGPAAPWQVDLEAHVATLGPMRVGFYRLPNGGFSPSSYRRADAEADLHRDARLLEDAYACIAQALARRYMPGRVEVRSMAEPIGTTVRTKGDHVEHFDCLSDAWEVIYRKWLTYKLSILDVRVFTPAGPIKRFNRADIRTEVNSRLRNRRGWAQDQGE